MSDNNYFCFSFLSSPTVPIGVSEVILYLVQLCSSIFGAGATAFGLVAGLSLQGIF